jgi:putative ABC transport system ATP-binding protein
VIRLEAVTKSFPTLRGKLEVLRGITLGIARGEFVAITGPSGSGKSTLLAILGCLDRPTEGRYILDGEAVDGLSDDREAEMRSRSLGFVFQAFHLIPSLTIVENLEVPLFYAGVPRPERRRAASDALAAVGLADRLTHRPVELSGGEQQRVAIARALIRKPALVLADEPTGNLDSHTSERIMAILEGVHADGTTLVMITHNEHLADRAERRIHLIDGLIDSDVRRAGRDAGVPA